MAQFVVVLDASIVNVALPSIGRDLDFAQGDLSWVVNSYTLFFGGFLLLAAVSPTCSAGAACSSGACGCSRSPPWSAASRRATSG
jgi:MFS family permease